MKLSEIINRLEEKFPKSNAESWDNVGLIIGDRNKEIKKIQISLDITLKAIEKAIDTGADLIISHHPFIFSPIKNINGDSLLGRKILKLIENKIVVYTLHTNLDSSKSGLNDFIGEKLGFFNGEIIVPIREENTECSKENENGIGRLYSLTEKENLLDVIKNIKEKLELKNIKISGYNIENAKIKKIAVVNGSGSSYWKKAKRMGADLLVTGDLKYHEALDANEEGMYILDVGHYESEHFFHIIITDILQKYNSVECYIFNDEPAMKYM